MVWIVILVSEKRTDEQICLTCITVNSDESLGYCGTESHYSVKDGSKSVSIRIDIKRRIDIFIRRSLSLSVFYLDIERLVVEIALKGDLRSGIPGNLAFAALCSTALKMLANVGSTFVLAAMLNSSRCIYFFCGLIRSADSFIFLNF